VFLTGYIAGVHFVQTLEKTISGNDVPGIVSVGRTSEGELDVVAHDSLDEAFDHVVVMLHPYAVVMTLEGDLYRWHVCRPDVPDDMVATIQMRAFITGNTVTTSTPVDASPITGDGEDTGFDPDAFFDGFAAGLDAEDHAFSISLGTLDVMAGLLLQHRAATPTEELR
jgi:hypothetical protein